MPTHARTSARPYLCTFLCVGLVVVLRHVMTFVFPVMHCEDGTFNFAFFYNNHDIRGLLRFNAEYVEFLPNLAGYCIYYLPTRWAPYLLALIALVFACMAYSVPCRTLFRAIIPDQGHCFALALLLALVPAGNHALVSCTHYLIWNALFIVIMLALLPPPASRRALGLRLICFFFLITTSPATIVIMPLLLYTLWRHRSRLVMLYTLTITAILMLYQAIGVRHAQLPLDNMLRAVPVALRYVVEKVGFELIAGNSAREYLYVCGHGSWVLIFGLLLTIVMATVIYCHRHTLNMAFIMQLVYAIFAITYLYILGRGVTSAIFAPHMNTALRYAYVPKLLLIVLLYYVTWRCWPPLCRWPRRIGLVMLVLLLLFQSYTNWYSYRTDVSRGRYLYAFLKEVRQREVQNGGKYNINMVFDYHSWPFHLRGKE